MPDLSIFKLDSETITIKDTTARQAAESAKTLATTASGNATTALNKINELESEKADTIISSTSGAIASFPDGADDMPIKSLKVGIEPVQAGSGDPSPDNVRPISGWTGVNVTRTGKNLLDIARLQNWANWDMNLVADGDYPTSAGNRAVALSVKPNTTYTISAEKKETETTWPSYLYLCKYSNGVGARLIYFSDNNKTLTFTTEENTLYYLRMGSSNTQQLFDASIGKLGWIQLELGSTATAYEPYQGETYEVEFPTEAGAVYGGTLDVTNGVLTVDRAQIASYAGETLPSTWISDRDVYSAWATPTTGAQVVYELAEPITYQLTAPEITTLLGQNNIWADTGDMSVTYRADTKLYIDNKFTELQALILENLEGETDHD